MAELVTTAIVLDREPTREYDEYIHLYSREHGRLVGRAVSSRKMHSRFSHHLDPLNLVEVRLVGVGSFVITDALIRDRFPVLRENQKEFSRALRLASFIRSFFPEGGFDERAWDFLGGSLKNGETPTREFLSLLGFGDGGECRKCSRKTPEKFFITDHSFLCSACSSKIPDNQLLYI